MRDHVSVGASCAVAATFGRSVMWKVKRMKAARIVVLVIALAAGGIAALLAGRSARRRPPAPAPVAQLETVDVLVAKADIGLGRRSPAQDMRWQTWPAPPPAPNFIRKSDRPDAIEQLAGAIARAPFSPASRSAKPS